jgi:hypothetical protein
LDHVRFRPLSARTARRRIFSSCRQSARIAEAETWLEQESPPLIALLRGPHRRCIECRRLGILPPSRGAFAVQPSAHLLANTI